MTSTTLPRSAARARSVSASARAPRSAASGSSSPIVSLTSRPYGGDPKRRREFELVVVERRGLGGRDGLDRRVVGLVALDDREARPIASAGSADGLGKQLVGALGRPLVGQVQGDVGTDHPDQGDLRDVQALRHQARPDEHVEAALG